MVKFCYFLLKCDKIYSKNVFRLFLICSKCLCFFNIIYSFFSWCYICVYMVIKCKFSFLNNFVFIVFIGFYLIKCDVVVFFVMYVYIFREY